MDVKIVSSFGEYVNTISRLAGEDKGGKSPGVLWFRGNGHEKYSLLPSLFRADTKIQRQGGAGHYSSMHYAEDVRTQHYNAKNFHFFTKDPSSRVEWLEVMQHHGVKTRVLDWSESSIHSLLFALEPFYDDPRFKDDVRRSTVPCVWVLEPQKLNKKIFELLRDSYSLRMEIFKELEIRDGKELDKIDSVIARYGNFEKYLKTADTNHIDFLVNLSSINDEIFRDRIRLKHMLCNGDIVNPYYYMLTRIYSDGLVLDDRNLPPLAVVHPYHSERIKAQKGVFTVFPFYERKEGESLENLKINLDAMELNVSAADCLHKIIIRNPQQIAFQMMANGINVSWLYPELPIVSNEIENHCIY
ncbi:MAG: FRG domain-containing protein [Clostridium sp.]|nr:FRG domain-containing protein [Clostridium sp.]